MTNREAALKTADIFNQQIMVRVRQRDNVLLMYLGAVGALLGFAFSANGKETEILLAIPYLCFGCSIVLSHHNLLIGDLLDFLKTDLHGFIINHCSSDCLAYEPCPQFETSKVFEKSIVRMLWLRTAGHTLILVLPCIIAIYANWNHASGSESTFPFGAVFLGACVLVIMSCMLLLWVLALRCLRNIINTVQA